MSGQKTARTELKLPARRRLLRVPPTCFLTLPNARRSRWCAGRGRLLKSPGSRHWPPLHGLHSTQHNGIARASENNSGDRSSAMMIECVGGMWRLLDATDR
jgi:hypothetical protein